MYEQQLLEQNAQLDIERMENRNEKLTLKYICSMKFIRKWFLIGPDEAAARKRLGNKINYLKQYQHSLEFESLKSREFTTLKEIK